MKESGFQRDLIKHIKTEFPDSIILKNDPSFKKGIPDLLVLNENKWAALEVKTGPLARTRPNQDYYVEKMNGMSYASFVHPKNEEEVLNDLRRIFKA